MNNINKNTPENKGRNVNSKSSSERTIKSVYQEHEQNQPTPSPYVQAMSMMECNGPEDLIRAIQSIQKDTIGEVIGLTKEAIDVTQKYVDANVECLQKQVDSLQKIVTSIYNIMRKVADSGGISKDDTK
jgi:hypothetical protein